MKTWVDLQELYWLLQELRLRRSLQGGAANAQGDLIAAKPLADYSPPDSFTGAEIVAEDRA